MTEDDTFKALCKPSFQEMSALIDKFHSSDEYLDSHSLALGGPTQATSNFLSKHNWEINEYFKQRISQILNKEVWI